MTYIRFSPVVFVRVLGASTADAQATFGSILGTVTDPTGSAAANAKVAIALH
jgi:hypothetical protein